MPVENEWYVEGRILVTRLIGTVTVDEMLASGDRGTIMIESGVAPVYSLVDVSQMDQFPTRLVDIKRIANQGGSDKMSKIILFGVANRFIHFLANMFTQFIKSDYALVDSLEDALAMIEEMEERPIDQMTHASQ